MRLGVRFSGRGLSLQYQSANNARNTVTFAPPLETHSQGHHNMAATTSITVTPIAEPKLAEAHLLPCEIMHNGPAAVNAYFKPRSTQGVAGCSHDIEAEFRGRELRGRTLSLADHQLQGWLLKDTVQGSVADGEQRRWVAAASFSQLHVYKHDDPPFDDDPMSKCAQWVGIASVLHGHID